MHGIVDDLRGALLGVAHSVRESTECDCRVCHVLSDTRQGATALRDVADKTIRRQRASGESPVEAMLLPVETEASTLREPEADPLIGQEIGGCLVEKLISVDAISSSYKAVQVSMDRLVTLRVLAKEMTEDKKAVTRFIETARAAGQLVHPNIVQVYDAGKEQGLYYIALEYVDGKTLKETLLEYSPGHPFDTTRALDIAEQIAAALEHAHGNGLVHRRVHLDNILIGERGVAKLAEIGFAASLAGSGLERKMRPGQRTPDFQLTAPEELDAGHSPDPRVDIYSLGAIMFVMMAGRLPFKASSEEEMIEKIRSGRRVPIEKLNPSLSQAVRDVISKAMAVAPEERYPAAADLRADILAARAPSS